MKFKRLAVFTLATATVLSSVGCGAKKDDSGVTDLTDLVEDETAAEENTDETTESSSEEDTTEEGIDKSSFGISYEKYSDSTLGFSLNYRSDWGYEVKRNSSSNNSETDNSADSSTNNSSDTGNTTGTGSSSQGVTFKASDSTGKVSITVSEIVDGYTLDDLTVDAAGIFEEHDAYLKYNTTTVGNFKGTIIDYVIEDQMKGRELLVVDGTNKLAYIVNASSSIEDFSSIEKTFKDMFDSFKLIRLKNSSENTDDVVSGDDVDDFSKLLDDKIKNAADVSDTDTNIDIDTNAGTNTDTNTDTATSDEIKTIVK